MYHTGLNMSLYEHERGKQIIYNNHNIKARLVLNTVC